MSGGADPFLLQKLEFLELELQESKEREAKLKKSYDSLLALMNATSPTFHTEDELEKVKSAYQSEVFDLKQRLKLDRDRLDSETASFRAKIKDLELELRLSDREKTDLRQKLTNLAVQKQQFQPEIDESQEKSALETRLQGLVSQFEQHKDLANREKERITREYESKLREFTKEKSELMTLITHADAKAAEQRQKLADLKGDYEAIKAELRSTRAENEAFKANRPTKRYRDAVEEEKQRLLSQVQSLQGKIQTFTGRNGSKGEGRRLTTRESASDRPGEVVVLRGQLAQAEKAIETLKSDLAEERRKLQVSQLSPKSPQLDDPRPAQVSNSLSTVRQSRCEDSYLLDKLKDQLAEHSHNLEAAKDQLRDSKVETAQLQLQKERIQVDLEKMNIESKQLKLDWSVERERLLDEIRKLKSEVKFLIGKLVKAKGKLTVGGELTDTLKQDTRSRSVNKTRLSARAASPQRHCVSPLNLSVITRAESPCWNQSLDVL